MFKLPKRHIKLVALILLLPREATIKEKKGEKKKTRTDCCHPVEDLKLVREKREFSVSRIMSYNLLVVNQLTG